MGTRTWAIVCAIVLSATPAYAQPVQTYAQFCTGMSPEGETTRSFRTQTLAAAEKQRAKIEAFAHVPAAVQSRLRLTALPHLVGVEPPIAMNGSAKLVLSDLDPTAPHWWEATVDTERSLLNVTPADRRAVQRVVAYPRFMAAYILANELSARDEPFPRVGCEALFSAWFVSAPIVLDALQRAIESPPLQDAALSREVRRAWNVVGGAAAGRDAAARAISEETRTRVGVDPDVTLVYRDVGLPGDGIGEIDVVRIGSTNRAYEIVTFGFEHHITLGLSPVCTVGDMRCAHYYVWP